MQRKTFWPFSFKFEDSMSVHHEIESTDGGAWFTSGDVYVYYDTDVQLCLFGFIVHPWWDVINKSRVLFEDSDCELDLF